jgi:5-methylthioadenosine/S-adenosylhomocysteine deaminase
MAKKLVVNGMILTFADEQFRWMNGSLAVDNGQIAAIGEKPGDWEGDDVEVIDAKGKLVLPGLINTHGHAAMALLRGYADDLPLHVWLQDKIWPIEARFDAAHVATGTQLAMLEMIRTGTTCFADMYSDEEAVAAKVEEAGMRASLALGVIGLCSDDEAKEKINRSKAFVKTWHKQAQGRVTTMLAPHAPYTCPPDFLMRLVEASHELDVPLHIHVSETAKEVEDHVKHYGKRPVEHLLELGVFDRPTLVAHAVHVNAEEIAIFLQKGAGISHNPGSNLKLGSGIAPVPQMLHEGLHVSLGTDGPASNNNLDMFEEIRLAALIHKGRQMAPLAVPADIALKMGTIYGAECLQLADQVGSLEVGKRADFIMVDAEQAHFYPRHDLISHLVYSASGADVTDVYVNGKALMRNREFLTIDKERVIAEAVRLAEKF